MALSRADDEPVESDVTGNGYANAEASSSKVTLEDLKRRKVAGAEDEIRHLKVSHAADLRDLFVYHDQYARDAPPTAPLEIPELVAYQAAFMRFYNEHRLKTSNQKSSISTVKLPSSSALRRRLVAEIHSAGSPPRPQVSTKDKGKASVKGPDGPAGSGLGSSEKGKASSDSAEQSAAASSKSQDAPDVQDSPMKTLDAIATEPPTLELPAAQASAGAPVSEDGASTQPTISLTTTNSDATPAIAAATQASQQAAGPLASQSQSVEPSSIAIQPLPAIQVSRDSEGPPGSDQLYTAETGFSLLQAVDFQPAPLHPTLRNLAPNPLSVTYASSLRPLPPDPFRKYTGTGVGGGAVLHRSRKVTSSTSSSSHSKSHGSAPGVLGPAGNGHTDLWKWYVRTRASPASGLVARADKCLLTKDWKFAFAEQRFIRVMDRIEKLKEAGNWSFRQLKKVKGPVVRRAHWDHLLEEMKWLQTDYREERRWKMAVAQQLARACRRVYKAKKKGVKSSLQLQTRRSLRDSGCESDVVVKRENVEEAVLSEQTARAASTAPREEDPPPQADAGDVPDAMLTSQDPETSSAAVPKSDVEMADVPNEAEADAAKQAAAEMQEKAEADEEAEAEDDGEEDADGEADADGDADDGEVEVAIGREPHTNVRLSSPEPQRPVQVVREPLPASHMPDLSESHIEEDPSNEGKKRKRGGQDVDFDVVLAPAPAAPTTQGAPSTADYNENGENSLGFVTTLRAPIFSMGPSVTTVTAPSLLECFDPEGLAQNLGIDLKECEAFLQANSISSLFPELPEYGPPPEPDPSKTEKRWDEGSLSQPPRLTQVSRLLDTKPLLVSTLEPSKNMVQGRWREDSDWFIAAKMADPQRGVSKQDADEMNVPATTIFNRRSNKPSKDPPPTAAVAVRQPHQPEIRAAQILWTSDEDAFLMALYNQYGVHWSLIADIFNSTRLCCPTDRREPWDCMDRWERITKAAAQGLPPPPPPPLPPVNAPSAENKQDGGEAASPAQPAAGSSNPPTGSSVAAKREKLQKKLISKFEGSRRSMRHSNIVEVMRKTAKRRELTAKAQPAPGEVRKVNLASHETHNTPKGGQVPTPQQLGALKADRDEAHMRQFAMYQQRRMEEQQRMAAQVAAAQAQQQQAAQQQSSSQPSGPSSQASQTGGQQSNQTAGQQNAASQGTPRALPINQARPSPMPMPRPPVAGMQSGNQRPGTPTQNQQAQQAQQQGAQQQQNITPIQRMTPQQQAMFAAQIRPPMQQFNMTGQGGQSPAPHNQQGSISNAQSGVGSMQQGQQQLPNPLANMSPAAIQQFNQTLQNTLAQSNITQRLTQEQLHSLASQLFRSNQANAAGPGAQRPPFQNLGQQQGQARPPGMQMSAQPRPAMNGSVGMQQQNSQQQQQQQQQQQVTQPSQQQQGQTRTG